MNSLNKDAVTKIMEEKGYKLSSFAEFNKDERKNNIEYNSVNQTYTSEHNLVNFLKAAMNNNGKFYFLELSNGLHIRVWKTK